MPNKCPVCGKRFKYLFMMNEHLKKSKICSTQVVQPDVEEAPQQLDLTQENGQIVVIQQEQHKCTSCELNFPSAAALIEHNQRCYRMEYKCNICSKRFKYEFGYNKHMDVEHGPNSRIVASTSTTTNVLSTNQNIVGLSTNSSNISPLKQKVTPKKTINYGKQVYKPYTMKNKCHICGKRFKEEFCLNKHIEVIHAEPKPKPKPPAVSTVVSTISDTDNLPQTLHYTTSKNQTIRIQPTTVVSHEQPQTQIIQYQTIQTIDGVQMVQEVQTVQAVEAVETMPKIMLCGYCNAPFTKKHYLTEHMSQLHSN